MKRNVPCKTIVSQRQLWKEICEEEYQRKTLSALQISSNKETKAQKVLPDPRSTRRHWKFEECVHSHWENFTPSEALKSLDLWGHQIDPWWLGLWSCAAHTQESRAGPEWSQAPSKSLGWRRLHSHWHRRNLFCYSNWSLESVWSKEKGDILMHCCRNVKWQNRNSGTTAVPGSRQNWASTEWWSLVPAEDPGSWWRTGSGTNILQGQWGSGCRWKTAFLARTAVAPSPGWTTFVQTQDRTVGSS